MPKIKFKGKEWECQKGEVLRNTIRKNGLSPHNGQATWLNCKGLGSCGTCAVEVEGSVNQHTNMEKWRLRFPPHKWENGLRLACQVKVTHDLNVKKHDGFWGEHRGA